MDDRKENMGKGMEREKLKVSKLPYPPPHLLRRHRSPRALCHEQQAWTAAQEPGG